MGKPSNEARIKNLETGISEILTLLQTKQAEPTTTSAYPPPTVQPVNENTDKYPIPPTYREIVYQVLNKNFGIRLEPMENVPSFLFTIVCPPKYSTLSPAELKSIGADIRPKVIPYAEGVNGVKVWAEKVFNSFSNETKALIAQDRFL